MKQIPKLKQMKIKKRRKKMMKKKRARVKMKPRMRQKKLVYLKRNENEHFLILWNTKHFELLIQVYFNINYKLLFKF